MGSKAKDLGLYLDAGVLAAGASLYGNWVDNLEWVRNVVIMIQNDQTAQMVMARRDRQLAAGWGTNVGTAGGVTSSTAWSEQQVAVIVGYGAKFGLKNTAAAPTTFAKLRLQLLGM